MSKNYYPEVIEIIAALNNGVLKPTKLLIEIAKNNPAVVFKNWKLLQENNDPDKNLREEVIELIKSDNFIDGVKHYRAQKGCSLYDAKAYCDKLKEGIKI